MKEHFFTGYFFTVEQHLINVYLVSPIYYESLGDCITHAKNYAKTYRHNNKINYVLKACYYRIEDGKIQFISSDERI